MADHSETLSYADAAQVLGLSVRSLKRHVAEGTVRHVRLGRVVRFRPADLEAFLDEHARGGAPLPKKGGA